MENLEQKLVNWYNTPEVRARNWEPNLFWYPKNDLNPFGRFKVDPWELEVLFASVLGQPSECHEALNKRSSEGDQHRSMGRADFIAIQVKRHELPLLTRA